MLRCLLKSKLHGATVTKSLLGYRGSLGIDESLMEAADIVDGEMVHVYNVNNGERFSTYAVPAPAGSGDIVVLGAAARLAAEGDTILILTYAHYDERERAEHRPRIAILGPGNRIESTKRTTT